MAGRCYLDWNATAPLRPEARAAMLAALDVAGNPSSVHAEGRQARALVERARAEVAALAGCQPGEVVFASGATEAARILSLLGHGRGVEVAPTAHDCLWAHRAPAPEGAVAIRAMGLANSETGILTWPGPEDLRAGGLLLLDIVQAVGRVAFSFADSGADLAIVSAHKLGGPKGIGALIVRDGLDIGSLAPGGGQETGRRSGTENVIGIAGFGAAAAAARADLEAGVWDGVEKLRRILEKTVVAAASETIFVGKDMPRIANTSCFAVPGWRGETQVMQMDLAGFAISAGSACSSGKVRESRVLGAMGYGGDVAGSAIRVSLGPLTTQDDVLRFAEAWSAQYRKFRARAA